MKEARLSVVRTDSLYQLFLVLISVTGGVDPRAVVRPEGLGQLKIPMTPSRIGPAAFRCVAQCLKQLRPHVSRPFHILGIIPTELTWFLCKFCNFFFFV